MPGPANARAGRRPGFFSFSLYFSLLSLGLAGLVLFLAHQNNVAIFRLLNGGGGPVLDAVMDTATQMSAGYLWFFVFFLLIPRNPELGARGVKALLIVLVAMWIVKQVYPQPRPLSLLPDVRVVGIPLRHGSFPSGHTATITAAAVILQRHLGWLGCFLYPLAIMGGVSRIYVGAHFPLDVAAGACLGIVSAWMAGLGDGIEKTTGEWVRRWRLGMAVGVSALGIGVASYMRFGAPEAVSSPYFYSVLFVLVLLCVGLLLLRTFRAAAFGDGA